MIFTPSKIAQLLHLAGFEVACTNTTLLLVLKVDEHKFVFVYKGMLQVVKDIIFRRSRSYQLFNQHIPQLIVILEN